MVGEDPEVLSGQRGTVDADQVLGDGPPTIGQVERLEVLMGGPVRPLAQMQDELLRSRDPRQEVLDVGGLDVGDVGGRGRQVALTCGLDVAHQPPEVADDATA